MELLSSNTLVTIHNIQRRKDVYEVKEPTSGLETGENLDELKLQTIAIFEGEDLNRISVEIQEPTVSDLRKQLGNPFRREMCFLSTVSPHHPPKTVLSCLENFVLLFIICVGNLITSVFLHHHELKHSKFDEILPTMLMVKGLVEMNSVARLSTEASLGKLDRLDFAFLRTTFYDTAFSIFQSLVLLSLSTFISEVIYVPTNGTNYQIFDENCLDTIATTFVTGIISDVIMTIIVSLMVFGVHRLGLDCDKLVLPLASALSETLTVYTLGNVFYYVHQFEMLRNGILLITFSLVIPLTYWVAQKDELTRDLVHSGWPTLLCAMIISTMSGHILHELTEQCKEARNLMPLVTGQARNLIIVGVSKMSTSLHLKHQLGQLSEQIGHLRSRLMQIFKRTSNDSNLKLMFLLQGISLPCQFLNIIMYWTFARTNIQTKTEIQMLWTVTSILIYTIFSQFHTLGMLYICYKIVHFLWMQRFNPDNYAIPILIAISDFLAIIFMVSTYKIVMLYDFESVYRECLNNATCKSEL